jgi:hypothetical protein
MHIRSMDLYWPLRDKYYKYGLDGMANDKIINPVNCSLVNDRQTVVGCVFIIDSGDA